MDTITKVILGITAAVAVGIVTAGHYVTQGVRVELADYWKNTSVRCLSDPAAATGTSPIQADLAITVDGAVQPIPAGVGIADDCVAEVHTLDETGVVHVRPADDADPPLLRDFFAVGGVPFALPNATRTVRVNGERIENAEALAFADGQQIEVNYATQSTTTSATTTPPAPSGAPQREDDLRFGI